MCQAGGQQAGTTLLDECVKERCEDGGVTSECAVGRSRTGDVMAVTGERGLTWMQAHGIALALGDDEASDEDQFTLWIGPP